MAYFSIPATASRKVVLVSTFQGVDFTNDPGNVDSRRSPNAINMIRDVPGKVRKCMGWHTISQYSGKINGFHKRRGDDYGLVHAGTSLYRNGVSVYSSMANHLSKSWQIKDNLFIIDGATLLVYDGTSVKPASEGAYVPTLDVSRKPSGGGTAYESLNLIQPKFKELFSGTQTDTIYHLSFGGLDSVSLVEVMNSGGNWVTKTSGTDYSVNLTDGTVTFVTAPGISPVTGEDNVRITASRTVSGYADRINKCTFGILYGISGSADRLFLSGNPSYRNYDWFSAQYDGTYWPDTGYSVLGMSSSSIVGYSIINNYLATHKDDFETERNIVFREGVLVNSEPAFPITNSLQGPGALASNSFGYLGTEPVFLTASGVYAVTTSDISGSRYSQLRSFFLNGKLLKESNLSGSFCCTHEDMYWLFVNGCVYILDGLQLISTDKSAPYSTRQYAGFYRTNVPAVCAWEDEGVLYFGQSDGKVCAFYTDKDSIYSYNDDGASIYCCWDTMDFSGSYFYKNKTFRYLAVRLSSAVATSVNMYCMRKGLWNLLKSDSVSARYLKFSEITFSKFTFSSDITNKTLHTKTRIKKTDKTRYRFENSSVNEPFGLMDWAIEYVESGNYKG